MANRTGTSKDSISPLHVIQVHQHTHHIHIPYCLIHQKLEEGALSGQAWGNSLKLVEAQLAYKGSLFYVFMVHRNLIKIETPHHC